MHTTEGDSRAQRGKGGLSRQSFAVAFAVFVIGYGTNISTPFLVPYRERLDLGDSQTQSIFVIYVIGILATLVLAGQLSDRFGRRAVVLPALLLSAASSVLLILGRNEFGFLLAGRVTLGMASGAGLSVGAAWLQEVMANDDPRTGSSAVGGGADMRAAVTATLAMYAGFGAGPPISAMFHTWLPFPLVLPFLLHILITLAALPLVAAVDETVVLPTNPAPWRPRIQLGIPAKARSTFLWTVLPVGIWTFGFPSVSFALFPVLVNDAVSISQVVVAAITGVCTAWGALLSRPTMKRIGPLPALGAGTAAGTCGYLLGIAAVVTGAWLLVWPAAILLGAASGIITAACLSLVAEITEPATRGTLTSTFYFIAYVGMTMPLVITTAGKAIGQIETVGVLAVIAATVSLTTPLRHRRIDLRRVG